MGERFTIVSQKTYGRRIMFSASIKADIRTWYVKKDGTTEIYLQVIIDRKKKVIGLGLFWPVNKFDRDAGLCMKSSPKDNTWSDYNLIIREAIARANDIVTFHRLAGRELTIQEFEREYGLYFNRTSFVEYFQHKLEERLRKGVIKEITYRNQKYSLGILRKFSPELSFSQLTPALLKDLDLYMINKLKLKDPNTRFGRHKDYRCYLNLAIKDGYTKSHPYKEFKIPKAQGKWFPLSKQQYEVLHEYYSFPGINAFHKRTLRRFLFACHTGLRISDLMRCQYDWLINDTLVFLPQKTEKFGKLLRLPLTKYALQLFEEEHTISGNAMFRDPTPQKSNETLKSISKVTNLNIRLHHHMARETFATLYLEFGGRLEVLKEYLAHSDIKTTMKYVHISQQRKRDEIARMDQLGTSTEAATPIVRLKSH